MKLDKELFENLNKEKDAANERAFLAERAINALQELCEHRWQQDSAHGYPEGPPVCEICGKEKIVDNQ